MLTDEEMKQHVLRHINFRADQMPRETSRRSFPVGSWKVLSVCAFLSICMYAMAAWVIVLGIKALR